MKKVFGAFTVSLLFILSVQVAEAVTVWYQPTPYPMKKMDGTAMLQDLNIVHAHEGWVSSVYYNQTFQRTNSLQMGGEGDQERIYVKFDLTGLPSNVDQAYMYLLPYATGYASTPYQACPVTSAWNLSMTWGSQPNYGACSGFYPAPTPWNWSGFWLQYPGGNPDWHNQWKSGALEKNGIVLLPQSTNNVFDAFYSTLWNNYPVDPYADARRPILMLAFTPTLELKMPLPFGHQIPSIIMVSNN